MNLSAGIIETAKSIGMNPLDLATIISYETAGTFDPQQKGPTTQWGQHEGLIQFGQPQQKEYGVDLSSKEAAIRSQLGANGAIARYFKSRGFKPGMGLLDAYSTVNAGAPGLYNRSDANNGGAPGTVADKVNNQMSGHRAKALALLQGNDLEQQAAAPMSGGQGSAAMTGGGAPDTLTGQQAGDTLAPPAAPPAVPDDYDPDAAAARLMAPPKTTPADVYSANAPVPVEFDAAVPSDFDPAASAAALEKLAPGSNAPPEQPAAMPEGVRQLGLTGRAVAQGAAGLVGLAYDPIAFLQNSIFGTDVQPLHQSVSQGLTDMGVPEPQNATERVVQEIGSGAVGGGGAVGVARKAASVLTGVGQRVAGKLAVGPAAQVAAGAGAGGAGQAAVEQGAGPVGQLAAGLAGGVAGGVLGGLGPSSRPPPRPPRPLPEFEPEDLGRIVQQASAGDAKATQALARALKSNPEAREAAERLGIDLPPDVFSDDRMVREAAGLTRSIAGSEVGANFKDAIVTAIDKADDAMTMLTNSTSIAEISDTALSSMQGSQRALKSQAKTIYNQIDAVVPNVSVIGTPNTNRLMNTLIQELGEDGLSSEARNVLKMATQDGGTTYARLKDVKSQVGQALFQKSGPYTSMSEGSLKRLYSALAEDQLDAVRAVGGDELRGNLRLANQMTAKQKALEKRIVGAFGKDFDGSIADKLETAARKAAKGDVSNLNRIMKVIPEDLRKEAMALGIKAATETKKLGEPGFGFSQFTGFYAGIRNNPPVFKKVIDTLGGEPAHDVLRDLYTVSKRVTEARANVLVTGKANQALVQGMTGEKMIEAIFASSTGQRAAQSAGAAIGGATMGGGGAVGGLAAGGSIAKFLSGAGKDKLGAAGNLFKSERFAQIVTDLETNGPTPDTVNRLMRLPEFAKWATVNSIKNPGVWLQGVLQSGAATESMPIGAQ